MKTSNEIKAEITAILAGKWSTKDGRKVPEPEDIQLAGNHAVKLNATVLYADLCDSTGLVEAYKDFFAAEVYKSYLVAACHVIRNNDGVITSFDGDRVMAVFVGDQKNSAAAKTSLQITYVVRLINDAICIQYPRTTFKLRQAIGIDTSPLFVARTGIRNSNDLVWVGRAANYAAKLCMLGGETYSVHMTEAVFNSLNETSKFGGSPRRAMWEKITWAAKGIPVYGSSWSWKF